MSLADAPCPVPLAVATRGGLVESIHRGHLAVVRPDGSLVEALGDADFPTYLRSAAKPFQALAVIEEGAADRYGVSPSELALMCGSVSGQDYHVAAVRSVLAKAGLDESLLECGIHKPSHGPTVKAMEARGEKPMPVHNNCAGKHAAMLLICAHRGFPFADYYKADHPLQRLIRRTVAEICDLAPEALGVGVDGCGVPVFRAPLRCVAHGYARFAAPGAAGFSADREKAVERLMSAALAHPEMIAGDERVCTETMRRAPGRFLSKTGAEASYGLSLVSDGLGVALKIEDGAQRALSPVVVELLLKMGQITEEDAVALAAHHKAAIKNHRREIIGYVEPALEWKASGQP